MITDRDMPSMSPPRHELAALADEIITDVRHYYGADIDDKLVRALRRDLIRTLLYVRDEAARGWLGSAIRRSADD